MLPAFDITKMSQAERHFLTKEITWRDKLIDHEMLKARIPLSLSQPSTPSSIRLGRSLGDLDRLPLELLHTVFSTISVADILSIYRYGENALRALIATQSAHRYTYSQLESVIFTTDCELCQEQGEILYILKLLRCCFRCLSSERRLLAVTAGYAADILQVPQAELQALPMLTTVPQDSHWSWKLGRIWMLDYTTALAISKSQETEWEHRRDRERGKTAETRIELADEQVDLPIHLQSVHPGPRFSIQRRRRTQSALPLLSLPWIITRPHEGPSGQHACSVYLPAVNGNSVKAICSQTSYFIHDLQPALHCAGCAHWWNYHSTLPFEYHTMYRGSLTDLNSPLMSHLSHCIYARMFWQKLSTLSHNHAKNVINGHNQNQLRISRWGSRDSAPNAAYFEVFSHAGANMIERDKAKAGHFIPSTALPFGDFAGFEPEQILNRAIPEDVKDEYGDMLFGSEAVSQAHWATANPLSCNDLFHGPVKLVMEKKGREARRIQKQRRHGEKVGFKGNLARFLDI